MPVIPADARRRTGRPAPGEYADYARGDIAAVPGDDATEALIALADTTPALFRSLAPAAERGLTYAPGKWTLKSVRGLAFHIAGHELHHHRIVRERYIPLLG
jgi:hypothetical protein